MAMKIIYMGTPEFAVGPLEAIARAGHTVMAVVTQPDKQKGRGRAVQYSPVKEWALAHEVPVLQPQRIRAPEVVSVLAAYAADIFVVAAFGQILSPAILQLPRYGCINIHASLLPRYRGAAPIQRSIIDGEKETGVTIMQMDKGLDTGDILFAERVAIDDNETGDSLHDKLSTAGAALITLTLKNIEAGTFTPIKQNDADSSYAPMLTKEEGQINWQLPAAQIERLIRGLNSWPSAYTFYQGKIMKIWAAVAEIITSGEKRAADPSDCCRGNSRENVNDNDNNNDNNNNNGNDNNNGNNNNNNNNNDNKDEYHKIAAGTITEVTEDSILVMTGAGGLRIKELQLEGKKRMSAADFLRGVKMTVGERLTVKN